MTTTDSHTIPRKTEQLRSLITADGVLELSLISTELPPLGEEDVLIEVHAAAINPSDLGLIFGPADISTGRVGGSASHPVFSARVPAAALPTISGRIGKALPLGNEGAGVVIDAGKSEAAQAMLGKTVAVVIGGMYATHRIAPADQCMVFPDDTAPISAASALVNPVTALGMLDTMRREGHRAIVHTAAASGLGQILNRLCIADKVDLINIVRSEEQKSLLLSQGATHVLNLKADNFLPDLIAALEITDATIAFDAIGGGKLASDILDSMEIAQAKKMTQYSRYGSTVLKQIYLYGGLDSSPTTLTRHAGMSWSIGGWILFGYINKIGPQAMQLHKDRIAREITTTFATSYSAEISLADVLDPNLISAYYQRTTGGKYVVNPTKA